MRRLPSLLKVLAGASPLPEAAEARRVASARFFEI
jgi:hypothetical protein